MSDLYHLGFNDRSIDLYVEAIEKYDEQKLRIGDYKPKKLKVQKSQGNYENHFVRLQDPFNFIVSEYVYHKLEQNKLTGWQAYDIESDELKTRYFGFQVVGHSGEILKPREKGFYTGINLDLETWDGSDFFIPNKTMMVICTSRAKAVLESMSIGNISLTNIHEQELYNA